MLNNSQRKTLEPTWDRHPGARCGNVYQGSYAA